MINNNMINPTAVPDQGLFYHNDHLKLDQTNYNSNIIDQAVRLPSFNISSTVVNNPSISTYDSTWLLGQQSTTATATSTTPQFDHTANINQRADHHDQSTLMVAPNIYDNSLGGCDNLIDPSSILSAYESALMAPSSMIPKLCDIGNNVDGNFCLVPPCSSSPQLAELVPLNVDSMMINRPSSLVPLAPSLSSPLSSSSPSSCLSSLSPISNGQFVNLKP